MKCLLDATSVKVLARAIHSLAKIGDELHISPMENGLTLKTVNASKSAYSAFNFHLPFFLDYTHISENTVHADPEEDTVIKCKLPMKSILSVFRSIGSLEKSVETCKIMLPLLEALLIIEFRCKHGIVKYFNLRYFECESVEAEFSKEGYPSKFSCSSRFYNETLQSFHSSTQEVTWSLAMDQVHLSNHIDDEIDPSKCVRTEVTLVKDEFIEFNVALCTQVTFCLKELRAILAFAEALKLDLDCRMEGAGQPVLFSLQKDDLYSADFLLATLTPALDTSASISSRTAKHEMSVQGNTSNHPSPVPTLRNKTDSRTISRANLVDSRNGSRASTTHTRLHTPLIRQMPVNDTPDHTPRLNSLSLIEPHPFPDMEVDLEPEIQPPPNKRARARYIFQNCLKLTQEYRERPTEVFAPDSEEDE
ncbi:cell cycle checkpoint control protein RAD9A-like isoform X2 [Daphnia pulicaria]|uniref:cell cycle checkpoint control protein RAD9A-like isoform X2 n=1 Tax=Daphnia pulicaria TaxID=35523 RepID=UPI001EEB2783|nr:cell cycle checkpoint control protein RAD9A-like isoform X2 [Daphnia pulicaria]